jgi:hypothetical protein
MDEAALTKATHLSQRDVRYVLHDILEGEASDGDLLIFGLFDLLQAMKFDQLAVTALLRHFRDPLRRLGLEYSQALAKNKQKSNLGLLHIINNRYCSLDGEEGVFDLKELAVLPRCPRPFVGLFVVLPELFWRLKRALEQPPRGRSAKAGSSILQAVEEDG